MENLFNNDGIFIAQKNLGWTFSFEANGKYPMIANRIFETFLDASTFMGGPTAIPGLILRVVNDTDANNGAYLVEKDGDRLWMNKIMTGDIDLQLSVVWCIEISSGVYEEVPEGTPGAIQCLKLVHAKQVTYIPLSKILILDKYAKIANVDASLALVNSSVNDKFAQVDASIIEAFIEISNNTDRIIDLSANVDEFIQLTEENIARIDSSMIEAFIEIDENRQMIAANIDHLVEVDSSITQIKENIADIDSSIKKLEDADDVHDERLERLDISVNIIETIFETDTVRTIKAKTETQYFEVTPIDNSIGNVTISVDASVCDSYNEDNPTEGLVTTNYIEDRIAWSEE